MIYFNIKPHTPQADRLVRFCNNLNLIGNDARVAFNKPLRANETQEDRAVAVHENLLERTASALIAAWDGEPGELLAFMQMQLGLDVPVVGTVGEGGVITYHQEAGE